MSCLTHLRRPSTSRGSHLTTVRNRFGLDARGVPAPNWSRATSHDALRSWPIPEPRQARPVAHPLGSRTGVSHVDSLVRSWECAFREFVARWGVLTWMAERTFAEEPVSRAASRGPSSVVWTDNTTLQVVEGESGTVSRWSIVGRATPSRCCRIANSRLAVSFATLGRLAALTGHASPPVPPGPIACKRLEERRPSRSRESGPPSRGAGVATEGLYGSRRTIRSTTDGACCAGPGPICRRNGIANRRLPRGCFGLRERPMSRGSWHFPARSGRGRTHRLHTPGSQIAVAFDANRAGLGVHERRDHRGFSCEHRFPLRPAARTVGPARHAHARLRESLGSGRVPRRPMAVRCSFRNGNGVGGGCGARVGGDRAGAAERGFARAGRNNAERGPVRRAGPRPHAAIRAAALDGLPPVRRDRRLAGRSAGRRCASFVDRVSIVETATGRVASLIELTPPNESEPRDNRRNASARRCFIPAGSASVDSSVARVATRAGTRTDCRGTCRRTASTISRTRSRCSTRAGTGPYGWHGSSATLRDRMAGTLRGLFNIRRPRTRRWPWKRIWNRCRPPSGTDSAIRPLESRPERFRRSGLRELSCGATLHRRETSRSGTGERRAWSGNHGVRHALVARCGRVRPLAARRPRANARINISRTRPCRPPRGGEGVGQRGLPRADRIRVGVVIGTTLGGSRSPLRLRPISRHSLLIAALVTGPSCSRDRRFRRRLSPSPPRLPGGFVETQVLSGQFSQGVQHIGVLLLAENGDRALTHVVARKRGVLNVHPCGNWPVASMPAMSGGTTGTLVGANCPSLRTPIVEDGSCTMIV